MAKYVIKASETTSSQGDGTLENPFKLEPSATWTSQEFYGIVFWTSESNGITEKVQTLDLQNSYVQLGHTLTEAQTTMYDTTNYHSFLYQLKSLTNGHIVNENCANMFSMCRDLQTITSDFCCIKNGEQMFEDCSSLTAFTTNSQIENGRQMFSNCSNLKTFQGDLSKCDNCNNMFYNCTSLESFSGCLTSITSSASLEYMFSNDTNLQFVKIIATEENKSLFGRNVLYIPTNVPFYISTDNGETWEQVTV